MIFRSPYPSIAIPEVPLPRFVLERASERRDKPAIIDGQSGRAMTFGEIAAGAKSVAGGLSRCGLAKGDVFAIWLPNVPEFATAFLGVASVGGIVTTINPACTAEECAFQLQDTGAKFLLTMPQLMDKARGAVSQSSVREVFILGEAPGATPWTELLQHDGPAPEVAIDARRDLVALPYSSGTSGRPKGVMLTHYNLVAQLCQGEEVFKNSAEEDRAIAVLPFFHIYGMALILLFCLRRGRTLVSMARFDLEQFLECLQRYGVTHAPVVPPIVLALAKHPLVEKFDLSRLKRIVSGAAPLGERVEQACADRLGCAIGQGYGMTELSGAAITNPDDPAGIRRGSVGVCWPDVEARIVDTLDGRELGPNERGELCIRGPNVMRGYYNRPEATAHILDADGWLHTGDVACVDDDGYFFIVDRVKDLIKYKGWQIAPAELEAVLVSHPAVADAAVIPSPDEEGGEVPKAFVVLRGVASPEEIMAFVAKRVAPHKKIRRIAIVDALPRSVAGKLLRRLLVERERAAMSAMR